MTEASLISESSRELDVRSQWNLIRIYISENAIASTDRVHIRPMTYRVYHFSSLNLGLLFFVEA